MPAKPSQIEAALARARASLPPTPLPHPDDARPRIATRMTSREVDSAIVKERARLAKQYPFEKEKMPPAGLVCSGRLP